jgi:ABC-type glutathione transport system ATPase component
MAAVATSSSVKHHPAISLAAVTTSYRRSTESLEVLKRIDLGVLRGEFLALMGSSGSGKSTLSNIIGGLNKPTSGLVIVEERSITSLSDKSLADWRARHVSFVFKIYHLHRYSLRLKMSNYRYNRPNWVAPSAEGALLPRSCLPICRIGQTRSPPTCLVVKHSARE